VLGLPIDPPHVVLQRVLSDLGAIAGVARAAPRQLERMLELGEEIAAIGREVLQIAERLDRRAETFVALGEQLDSRAQDLLELGGQMYELGNRIDARGGEIVERAGRVVETGGELIGVLPALERAIEMTTPLEGAIDRFGRLVDRLPGGASRRRITHREEAPASEFPSPDPSAPRVDDRTGADPQEPTGRPSI
jgi:hypothetical protein